MDFDIVAISGGLSHNSVSSGLVRAALLARHPHLRIHVVDISQFPLLNMDDVAQKGFPPAVEAVRKAVSGCDGVLACFSNHNSLISAPMKNAYDWISLKH